MRYASFFTGAMGLDLGWEQAGWHCALANESDKAACETVRLNRPSLNLVQGDIRSLTVGDVPTGLDAVIGGPPCQAFSTAGKRMGLNDERGNVFLHFLSLAVGARPRAIVIENVRGLLSCPLVHRPHSERGFGFAPLSPAELPGGALAHVLATLRSAGYSPRFELYDTSKFGVPQRRERLVLVASRERPIHPLPVESVRRTFRQAVEGIKHHEWVPLRPKQAHYLRMLGPGQNWRDLPQSVGREAMGPAFNCSGGRTGFYRRLAWDEPSPTLMTSPTMPATLLGHPAHDRPLSVQEYARLQTFPDEWVFAGTLAQKYRQIGNAVPVLFGRLVAEHVARSLTGEPREAAAQKLSRYRNTSDRSWESGMGH